jgi:hypothetical protein
MLPAKRRYSPDPEEAVAPDGKRKLSTKEVEVEDLILYDAPVETEVSQIGWANGPVKVYCDKADKCG